MIKTVHGPIIAVPVVHAIGAICIPVCVVDVRTVDAEFVYAAVPYAGRQGDIIPLKTGCICRYECGSDPLVLDIDVDAAISPLRVDG